jgi:hypothetical protein
LQAGNVIVREVGLEFVNVEPEVCLGVKLYCVEIAQNMEFGGEAAADMPEGCRERATRLALWPVIPKETNQPLPGLGLMAMEDQIGQQGLGFERGRLGQRLVTVVDV